METNATLLMQRYQIGRLLGRGAFAKVYYARNLITGQSVAIKVIDKTKIKRVGLKEQIKREISIMRLVKHPNVVELYEVMASKTKIYFAMEYVKGGELFAKVVKGKLDETLARKYFQQLIGAVDYCHSRGVYHRDLKPENILVDEHGDLKVSDFGLSALWESRKQDGLLHTTCGTPAYVAPEIITKRGYDGSKADVWSCGVVLFVLLAGFLPFHNANLVDLYRKIIKGEFKCPNWFNPEVRKLLCRILDPNPRTRITLNEVVKNAWFRKGLKQIEPPKPPQRHQVDLLISDVHAAFNYDDDSRNNDRNTNPRTSPLIRPTYFNAFDIISLSSGLDLSGLFEKDKSQKLEPKFTTTKSPSQIVSKLKEIAVMESFSLKKSEGTVSLKHSKEGRKGQLAIDVQIFEVNPAFYMVEMKKTAGDTLEYKQLWDHEIRPSLQDIVWAWHGAEEQKPQQCA